MIQKVCEVSYEPPVAQGNAALLDHLVNVELKGSHQDVVQWFWTALTSKKHVQAGLWEGNT